MHAHSFTYMDTTSKWTLTMSVPFIVQEGTNTRLVKEVKKGVSLRED